MKKFVIIIIAICFSVLMAVMAYADSVTKWNKRNSPTTSDIADVTYCKGNYFAVASDSKQDVSYILWSQDGVNWLISKSFSSMDLSGITCGGNDEIVIVGEKVVPGSGVVTRISLLSSEGINWTTHIIDNASGAAHFFNSVDYLDGLFVATALDMDVNTFSLTTSFLTSMDGINWTVGDQSHKAFNGSAYGNGMFVVISGDGSTRVSTDGLNWSVGSTDASDALYNIGFGNGVFVAIGDNGTIMTSADGMTWNTALASAEYGELVDIAFGGNTFVVVGSNGTVLQSQDAVSWTKQNVPAKVFSSVAYGNNSFVVVGNGGKIFQSVPENTLTTFVVTPSAGTGGSIAPSTPQTVDSGTTTSFTITPNAGYSIASVTGCGGTLTGNTYATGPITTDCEVTASFSVVAYKITGTVKNFAGAGMANVTMTLTTPDGEIVTTTKTDSNGNYRFKGLVNGTYTVTPSKTGKAFTPKNRGVAVNGANATVKKFTATKPSPTPTTKLKCDITAQSYGFKIIGESGQETTIYNNETTSYQYGASGQRVGLIVSINRTMTYADSQDTYTLMGTINLNLLNNTVTYDVTATGGAFGNNAQTCSQ